MPKYPHIHVQLTGEDGNPFFIIARVRAALRRGGVPSDQIGEFISEAMASDYDNVLATVVRWVEVS